MPNQDNGQNPNYNPNIPPVGGQPGFGNNSYPPQNPAPYYPNNQIPVDNSQGYPPQNYQQNPYQNNYSGYPDQQFTQVPNGFSEPGQPDFQNVAPPKPKFGVNISNFLVKKWWLVALVVVIMAVSVVVAWYFSNPSTTPVSSGKYPNVIASISAPKTLPQGTPGSFEVNIENKENVPVSNLKIELKFDSDFQFLREISPKSDVPEGNKYTIARLDAAGGRSSSVKITFEGILTGKTDIEVQMSGIISYQAEIGVGKLSTVNEIKLDTVRSKITSPQIDLNLSPTSDQVQNNSEVEFTIRLNNRTEQEIKDLRLRMTYPSGQNSFTYTSSEYSITGTSATKTSPDDSDNTWLIGRLAGGAEHVLKVRGKVLGANNVSLTFGVEVAIKGQNNDYRVIRQNFKDIKIQAQPLTLSTSIAGRDSNKVITPGETLVFNVTYKNDSQQTFNNVQITSFVTDVANLLDLSTITFAGGERGDITGSQITWQPTRVPQLGTLRPTQSGQFQYSIKVKDLKSFLNTNLNQTQYTIRPGVQAKAQNLEQVEFVGDLYKGKGQLEFFQDEPVFKNVNPVTNGSVYSFTFRARSWQNEINDVVLKTISPLPPGAWLNKVTPEANATSISYNNVNGEIVWTLGKLNSYTGSTVPEASITFEMEVPKASSKQLVFQKPTITGTDIFTGEKFNLTGKQAEVDTK